MAGNESDDETDYIEALAEEMPKVEDDMEKIMAQIRECENLLARCVKDKSK